MHHRRFPNPLDPDLRLELSKFTRSEFKAQTKVEIRYNVSAQPPRGEIGP